MNNCGNNRLKKIRAILKDNKLDALYLKDVHSIHWITGFEKVFDSSCAHALIIAKQNAVLHTDTRYINSCKEAAKNTGINLDVVCSGKSHHSFALDYLNQFINKDKFCLGIENSISLKEYRDLEKTFSGNLELIETDNLIVKTRQVKDSSEIKIMRAAQKITDSAFSYICEFIKPGLTEKDLQLELENYMYSKGAQNVAFSTIIAAGSNAANPHAIPGSTVLEAGQCVLLDYGAKYKDYCSDMTRTIFLGMPDSDSKIYKAFFAVKEANEIAEKALCIGAKCSDIHNLAEDVLKKYGFGGKMGHSLGHGVGMEIHEEPRLAPKSEHILTEGNVVTVEPGVYCPGEFGIRLEDFGVITQGGFESFTQSTHDMVIK